MSSGSRGLAPWSQLDEQVRSIAGAGGRCDRLGGRWILPALDRGGAAVVDQVIVAVPTALRLAAHQHHGPGGPVQVLASHRVDPFLAQLIELVKL